MASASVDSRPRPTPEARLGHYSGDAKQSEELSTKIASSRRVASFRMISAGYRMYFPGRPDSASHTGRGVGAAEVEEFLVE